MKKLILTLEEQEIDLSNKPLRHRKIGISGVIEIEKTKENWLEYAVKELVDKFNEVIYEDTGFTTFEDKLAAHDKEVRKQVCDEVIKELFENKDCYFEIRKCNSPHYQGNYVWCNENRFNKLLDQIEKGEIN